jgi:hypothetical protein
MQMESTEEKPAANGIMVLGTIANCILCLFSFSTEHGPVIGMILSVFAVISIIGLIVAFINPSQKAGPVILAIGSFGFVPLGLLAIFGVRKHLDMINKCELEIRRAAQNNS